MNPLHAHLTEGCIFSNLDKSKRGISVYKNGDSLRGFLNRVLDTILGRAVPITVAGETFTVDKESAEDFFSRNTDRFLGLFREGMSLQDKILKLHEVSKKGQGFYYAGLPRGFLEEVSTRGKERKNIVIGMRNQFFNLIKGLELNGFDLSSLREEINNMPGNDFIRFEREDFVDRLVKTNKDRILSLKDDLGRGEIRALAREVITKIKKLHP